MTQHGPNHPDRLSGTIVTAERARLAVDMSLTRSQRRCQCGGCGQFFWSVSAFDKHRTGAPDARRCLTEAEMYGLGMTRNDRNWWITEAYNRDGDA